jgi:BON domain
MENSNPARQIDSRDSRTEQGEEARPIESRTDPDEIISYSPADDPVTAADPSARPSDYTQRDIDEGNTPLDEDMERLVDPSMDTERISNNFDVLDLDSSWLVEGEEPDFMGNPGTVDVIESVEEAEPYFPATDPPMTTRPLNNAGVLGGFASDSYDETEDDEDSPLRVQGGDDEIAARVRRALRSDAYTGELNIHVEVEDGVAYLTGKVRSLEDIEQAEQVAGDVPGVEEVEEELEIV